MLLELTRRRKLAKFVSHHVLGNEHGIKNLTVMNQKCMANEVRGNHRPARPSLDRLLRSLAHLLDFLEQLRLYKRAFF